MFLCILCPFIPVSHCCASPLVTIAMLVRALPLLQRGIGAPAGAGAAASAAVTSGISAASSLGVSRRRAAPGAPFSSTRVSRGMDEFFAPPLAPGVAPQRAGALARRAFPAAWRGFHTRTPPLAGRAWTAAELRIKSFEDLHCLWCESEGAARPPTALAHTPARRPRFLCLKERNFLLTERLYYRQMLQAAPDSMRLTKVKRTMAAVRLVVRERARAAEAMREAAERSAKASALASVLSGALREGGAAGEGAAVAGGALRLHGGSRAGAAVGDAEQQLAADKASAAAATLHRLRHVRVWGGRGGGTCCGLVALASSLKIVYTKAASLTHAPHPTATGQGDVQALWAQVHCPC